MEAEDWEPAVGQRAEARSRAQPEIAAKVQDNSYGAETRSADATPATIAQKSRVARVITVEGSQSSAAAAAPLQAVAARSADAAISAQQQLRPGARFGSIIQTESTQRRSQPAAQPPIGALMPSRAELKSRTAGLMEPGGSQHGGRPAALPDTAAAVPFDAEKAFRRASPPGILSLAHIVSKPPASSQVEAPVQQLRWLADAPPLGTNSSPADVMTSAPAQPAPPVLPAVGAQTTVARLADAPPLGSHKQAAAQPGVSNLAPSAARTATVRLKSRWGHVDPADAAEGAERAQRKAERLPLPDSAPSRGVSDSPPLVLATAGTAVVKKGRQRAEGGGAAAAAAQPSKQAKAQEKPVQPRSSPGSGSKLKSSDTAGRPSAEAAAGGDGKPDRSGVGVTARQQRAALRKALAVKSDVARMPESATHSRADAPLSRDSISMSAMPGQIPDWMVSATAALHALPPPFVSLPLPFHGIGAFAGSTVQSEPVGPVSTAAIAFTGDLPPHLLAASVRGLGGEQVEAVPAAQRPSAADAASVQSAHGFEADSRPQQQQQQMQIVPEQRHPANVSSAADLSKASRRRRATAELVASAQPLVTASASADGAAARPASAASVRVSTVGGGTSAALLSGPAPVRKAPKAAAVKSKATSKAAAGVAISTANASAATAVARPGAPQPQRYVPTGRLDHSAAPGRKLVPQAAVRPAPVRVTTWEAPPPQLAPDPNLIITFESSDDEEEEGHAGGVGLPVPASPAEAALSRAAQAAAAAGSAPPLAASATDDALALQMAQLRAGTDTVCCEYLTHSKAHACITC